MNEVDLSSDSDSDSASKQAQISSKTISRYYTIFRYCDLFFLVPYFMDNLGKLLAWRCWRIRMILKLVAQT